MEKLADINLFESLGSGGFGVVCNDWKRDMAGGARVLGRGLLGGVGAAASALKQGYNRAAPAVGRMGAAVKAGATAFGQGAMDAYRKRAQQKQTLQEPPQGSKAASMRKAQYLCSRLTKQLGIISDIFGRSAYDQTGMVTGPAADQSAASTLLSAAKNVANLSPSLVRCLMRMYSVSGTGK